MGRECSRCGGKPKGKISLGSLDILGMIILKWTLDKNERQMDWIQLAPSIDQ
jgi:hypothetical protein